MYSVACVSRIISLYAITIWLLLQGHIEGHQNNNEITSTPLKDKQTNINKQKTENKKKTIESPMATTF